MNVITPGPCKIQYKLQSKSKSLETQMFWPFYLHQLGNCNRFMAFWTIMIRVHSQWGCQSDAKRHDSRKTMSPTSDQPADPCSSVSSEHDQRIDDHIHSTNPSTILHMREAISNRFLAQCAAAITKAGGTSSFHLLQLLVHLRRLADHLTDATPNIAQGRQGKARIWCLLCSTKRRP